MTHMPQTNEVRNHNNKINKKNYKLFYLAYVAVFNTSGRISIQLVSVKSLKLLIARVLRDFYQYNISWNNFVSCLRIVPDAHFQEGRAQVVLFSQFQKQMYHLRTTSKSIDKNLRKISRCFTIAKIKLTTKNSENSKHQFMRQYQTPQKN